MIYMADNNYIWIFGENNAKNAKDNVFSLWKYALSQDDDVRKYLVLKKNSINQKLFESLSSREKEFVLWFNSTKHVKTYSDADLLFVSSSIEDVIPTKYLKINYQYDANKSVIVIPNETSSLIRPNITGESLNGKIFRYCVFDKRNLETLNMENNFNEYQLKYAALPPKYCESFFKKDSQTPKDQILWIVEWRYYIDNRKAFVDKLCHVLKSDELKSYLKDNGLTLKVCLHQYYTKKLFKDIYDCRDEHIVIMNENNADLNEEMTKSKLLITDYSSHAFDFALLKRPVLLYQPDLDEVNKKRELNIDLDELRKYSITNEDELISNITNEDYGIIPAFDIWDENISIDADRHIKELYDYFLDKQKNKITFLGYNFYGLGGTVNATKGLAESLMEEGYMVEMFSLFKIEPEYILPNGINFNHAFEKKLRKDRIKTFPFKFIKKYGYLRHETNVDAINSYSAYRLRKLLKNIKSNTVVSTRDTLHLFLEEAKSEFIKNKLYFFHASADAVDVMYPGLMPKLKKKRLSKAIFVTENNRLEFERIHGYNNYDSYMISGNTIESSKIIDKNLIETVPKKDIYHGIYLLRISIERKNDIQNLFDFARYLKKNNIKNIIIDVYGNGNYVDEFLNQLHKENLQSIIHYKNKTNNPIGEIRNHDFMCDLTLIQSFGMTYLEGILNGKKVFCMKNPGSLEVMNEIPNSYIESFDWLCNQIENIDKVPIEELKSNYDNIYNKYSPSSVCKKFISFLD